MVELLLSGKTTTPADLVKDIPGDNNAKAEIIENNLKHEIVKKIGGNSVYYGKLSEMLQKIIDQRKIEALSYDEYLRQVVELAEAILHPESSMEYPDSVKDVPLNALCMISLTKMKRLPFLWIKPSAQHCVRVGRKIIRNSKL